MQLLLNAEVYDPAPLGRRHLLIGAGRILWMGDQVPELGTGLGVESLDLGGARVVPGDLPPEVLEEEDTTRTIPRRFGLSDVVERQIRQMLI